MLGTTILLFIKKYYLFASALGGELIGSFITQVRLAHLLLVLLLSVYVNLVKELFLSAFTTRRFNTFIFFRKASAKVLFFFDPAKFFPNYF